MDEKGVLANNLERYRTKHALSKKEMADELNVSYPTYCNYEYGNREPNITELTNISRTLGISLDILLTGQYETGDVNEGIRYDLNGETPKLFIKGESVGVVAMSKQYVTSNDKPGTDVTTFVYIEEGSAEQKVISFDSVIGRTFKQ